MEIKYKGVHRKRIAGRDYFTCTFGHDGTTYRFGLYNTPKEAAKAHDLFVIKNRINRETNFFKKKLA